MLNVSLPPSLPESAQQVQVADALAGAMDVKGICEFARANTDPDSSPSALYMAYANYLQDILPKDLSGVDAGKARTADQLAWFENWANTIRVVVIRTPQHGRMVLDDRMYQTLPSYVPDNGFVGKDRVDVLVSAKDASDHLITRKLVYFINVLPAKKMEEFVDHYQPMVKRYCGRGAPVWPIRGDESVKMSARKRAGA
jgi:hypothetical protein